MSRSTILVLLALLPLAGCGDDDRGDRGAFEPIPRRQPTDEATPAPDEGPAGTEPVAILDTTQGEIVIRFFPGDAPQHVQSFLSHCKKKLYRGTYFHRVGPTFMIQGGDFNTKDDDPANDGQGGYSYRGPGTTLRSEWSDRQHVRGILSMARQGGDPHSAGSQFFIIVKDSPNLDGQYSVFGEVVSGMDAVDRIANQPGEPIDGMTVRPFQKQRIDDCRVEHWKTEEVDRMRATRDD